MLPIQRHTKAKGKAQVRLAHSKVLRNLIVESGATETVIPEVITGF